MEKFIEVFLYIECHILIKEYHEAYRLKGR
jgi:hypothetical protein